MKQLSSLIMLAFLTASGDGASATLTLNVTPDPGKPGLYHVPWRADEKDPTMQNPTNISVDRAGNIYVLLRMSGIPYRSGPSTVIKIATDGTFSDLINYPSWFGKPFVEVGLGVDPTGFEVDRAGNLYFFL